MYYSWLDRWDEHRTRRRDNDKKVTELALDPELAFPAIKGITEIGAFCEAAERVALASYTLFCLPDALPEAHWDDLFVRFPSSISTGIVENDMVHTKVTRAKATDHAVLVFHHWNASSRNTQLARFLAKRGICVFEMAMPYHLERSRPGATHADHMLSPNLGRTIQSIRQAVADGRQLIQIAQRAGYRKISVMGISLGSWVAGLVAAHDPVVERASLFLTAGDLAEMVWTGSATRHIRASLEGRIGLSQLRRAWAPLNLENHAASLARPELDLQIVLAKRDRVVLPALSERLMQWLEGAGAAPTVVRLNCGHYSLTLPPYAISSGVNASRFLRG
jgi:hypothetical protein